MRRKLALICVGLGVVGTVSLLGQEVISTERMDFAPGGIIRVIGSYGDLTVEGWDRPEVEVTLTKSVLRFGESASPDQDQRRLDSIHFATERKSATEIAITTTTASRHGDWIPSLSRNTTNGVQAKYVIHAPRDSRLEIRHGIGYVLVTGLAGDIDASAHRGDIVLMLPDAGAYSIDAKTRFGKVTSDLKGSTVSRLVVGQRFATAQPSSGRKLRLRMGFGGITIKPVPPDAEGPVPPAGK